MVWGSRSVPGGSTDAVGRESEADRVDIVQSTIVEISMIEYLTNWRSSSPLSGGQPAARPSFAGFKMPGGRTGRLGARHLETTASVVRWLARIRSIARGTARSCGNAADRPARPLPSG